MKALVSILFLGLPLIISAQTYTLPMDKARLLVQDALIKREQDSLIALQEVRIIELRASIKSQQEELNKLVSNREIKIDSLSQSITDLHGLLQDQALRAAEAEGRFEKEKSKDFTIGPAIGIDYRGKPTVSIGVTYRLWSFRLKKK